METLLLVMQPLYPSNKSYYFGQFIYFFFPSVMGDICKSCIRLALTDDKSTIHGLFETCVETVDRYNNAVNMLCVFRQVVMKFHKCIYTLMPHKPRAKVLTCKGELYGQFIIFCLQYRTISRITLFLQALLYLYYACVFGRYIYALLIYLDSVRRTLFW